MDTPGDSKSGPSASGRAPKVDLNDLIPLFFFMLVKREGGLVSFKDEEFLTYTGQRIRVGTEVVEGGINVFYIEGE